MTAPRHPRVVLTFECPGCDGQAVTFTDEAVIVKSPGSLAVVVTCPGCDATCATENLLKIAAARSGGTPCVVLTPGDLAAGAQCDGPISEREVAAFVDRLAATPDGAQGVEARRTVGQYVVLGALWAELAEVAR